MDFLLVLVRMVLALLAPSWRDRLTLGARADGRIEHLPIRRGLWDRRLGRNECGQKRSEREGPEVRATSALRRLLGSQAAD